jgi:hypothetical protein
MELLDFPEEILMEILSKLDQEHLHSAALVCKRFLHLTRSPQLLKCVEYQDFCNEPFFSATKFQSLLVMLRDNKHIEKLTLETCLNVLEVLKVVAPHGSLRHLELKKNLQFHADGGIRNQDEEWKKVFSQICSKLTSFEYFELEDFNCLAPLVNAKYLTTLKLEGLPTSETFRYMADNYTCLQNVEFDDIEDCSENSELAHFLEKQSGTLTSLVIVTWDKNPLPAISKCQKLKRLHLKTAGCSDDMNLDSLGSLSNLRYLFLEGFSNSNMGQIIETANFQHLNEIKLKITTNLFDNDISQIARTYGQQVYIKVDPF